MFNIDFRKIKEGLTKTRNNLINKITETVTRKAIIDENTFEELEDILIASDLGVDLVDKILESVRKKLLDEKERSLPILLKLIKEELKLILSQKESLPKPSGESKPPHILLFVGINGAGKTTTVGKLAYNYHKDGKSVIIGSADTYRAAANDQLKIWAERASARLLEASNTKDPGAVAYETIQIGLRDNIDIIMIDTAGRLHNNKNLMAELVKVSNIISSLLPNSFREIYLVLDANLGQNALRQLTEFKNIIDITGLIVTKLDGTAKGGSIVQLAYSFNIPIRYIGVGEGIDDLQPFDASAFIDAILT
jgi:fused signal recognition particle receptor